VRLSKFEFESETAGIIAFTKEIAPEGNGVRFGLRLHARCSDWP
jgi:hypothetical protein